MLRTVIMCPDATVTERLEEVIAKAGRIAMVKSVDRYLTGHELDRFLRANAPQVLFLSLESMTKALEVVAGVEQSFSGIQIVAIDRQADPAMLLDVMRAGIREFLSHPFEPASFQASMARLQEVLGKKPMQQDTTDMVYSFLPAKAGAGTSTVALNTAVALSKVVDGPALLMDCDLNSGLIAFMLRLEAGYTIYDAAENALRMDEHMWPQLISSAGKLHVLPAGKLDPQIRIEAAQIRELLNFARRFYKAICLDLSGNMEKFSLELMQESKKIFVVCTPEIPSLHLARQKIQFLRKMDMEERMSVLLNRSQKRSILPMNQIEQMLGAPVQTSFPNDYRGVHEALTEGKEVNPTSDFGRQVATFAQGLLSKPGLGIAPRRRKFLEFFSVDRSDESVISR